MNDAAWWPFGAPARAERVSLLCLPYAGGGASIYRRWSRAPIAGIEVCPVQLPGREGRIREAAFRRMEPLAAGLAEMLRPRIAGPYAIFGHSMGALIGFELARRLGAMGLPQPSCLFVSASRAPHRPRRGAPLHTLSDPDFTEALRDLNGTPEQVLAHRELMDLILPTLKADFELCETYEPGEHVRLTCPVAAFAGAGDRTVLPEDMRAWAEVTSGGFRFFEVPGDHFFLESCSAEVLQRVQEIIGPGRPGEHEARDRLDDSHRRPSPGAR